MRREPQPSIAAVLALVVRDDQILLVRRANDPDAGLWGFPSGKVEFGETLLEAAERELREETGVRGRARRAIVAVEAFDGAPETRLQGHYVLIGVLCQWEVSLGI